MQLVPITYISVPTGNDGKFLKVTSTSVTFVTLGSVVTYNVGTSGGTIPLLNTANTWSGKQTFNSVSNFNNTISSFVANGTEPITVNSSTLVNNLNVQYLNGQLGSYYLNAGNLTGTLAYARLASPIASPGTYANATVTVNAQGIVTAIVAGTGGGLTESDLAFKLGYF